MSLHTFDFNGFSAGTLFSDQYAPLGLSISSFARHDRGGNGAAMIFDTAHPTGGDFDLAFPDRGGALILSEDGDSSDPDDDRCGGTFVFDFDAPVSVESLTFLDVEKCAKVIAFDENGDRIGWVKIPGGANHSERIIDFDFDGVASLKVKFKGEGAIDDLVIRSCEPSNPTDPDIVDGETSGELPDGTDVTFGIETPGNPTSETSTLTASLRLGTTGATNVVFVTDVSGSTLSAFGGDPVGDPNGDGWFDTILDAEIVSLQNLSSAIGALSFADEIGVGLVTFDTLASLVGSYDPGSAQLNAALASLQTAGSTNYAAALQTAYDYLASQNAAGQNNIIYFLSDGYPNVGGSYDDEVQALEADFNAQIVSIGVGAGSSIFDLDLIDNTGPGAEIVTSTDELDTALLGPAIDVEIDDFIVFVNGVEQTDIDETDLVETAFGYELPEMEIGDLDPTLGAENEVIARVTLDDGTTFEVAATVRGGGFAIDPDAII